MRRYAFCAALLVLASVLGCGGSTGPGADVKLVPPTPPAPVIALSSENVDASLLAGAASATYDVDITASGITPLTSIAVSDVSAPAASWLSFTISGSTAPAKLSIRVSPATLAAGTFTGSLRVSASGADAKTIRINLIVAPRTKLVLDKTSIAMSSDPVTPVANQTVVISSVNGSVDGLSVSQPNCTSALHPWLTITLSSSKAPATITLAIDQSGFVLAMYTCKFTVSTPQAQVDSASQEVTVVMTLKNMPRLALSRDTVTVVAIVGQPSSTTVDVTNNGTGVSSLIDGLSLGPITYGPGTSGWLSASLNRAVAPAVVTLSDTATGLAVGTYSATIPVSSTALDVRNSPATITALLTVQPAPPALIVTPASLTFTMHAGTSPHFVASVAITTTSSTPLLGMSPGALPSPVSTFVLLNMDFFFGCPTVAQSNGKFNTPCEYQVMASPPASLPVGSYSVSLPLSSSASNVGTALPVTVNVIP